jgi:ABC-type uncharacterized transport system involved in gliding motility auxiliary subunit
MRGRLARTAAVLAAIVAVGFAVSGSPRLYDLTEERSLTLTAQTIGVLDRLDRDVEVTAFLRRDEPGRVEAAALLDRYADESGRLDWEVVDPDDSPGEVARLGIDPILGGVAVHAGDDVEQAASATEQDLTAALARLVREGDAEVCITTGHGEPQLRAASASLEREGYVVTIVDLLATAEVPASCTALVLASPTEPLGDAGDAIASWTADEGRLLVLTDPVADVDLDELLEPYALGVGRGIVFEGDAAGVIGGDVTSPIVRTYSSGHPIVRRLAPTYFPAVQAVLVDDDAAAGVPGLTVSRLADTSAASYLETAPVEATFDPAVDTPGPVTVAAAAERSRNDGERIRRTRVVVVGDVDFASNSFLGEAGNETLLVRAVAWLTLDEDLLALSPNLAEDRPLRLTDARLRYARVLTAGVVPALFVLGGALVWALRRGR